MIVLIVAPPPAHIGMVGDARTESESALRFTTQKR